MTKKADLMVIGFGGAGATAAIEAYDPGASVIVLEKAEAGGGTTQELSGNIRIIADHDKAAKHYCALTLGTTPLEVITYLHVAFLKFLNGSKILAA